MVEKGSVSCATIGSGGPGEAAGGLLRSGRPLWLARGACWLSLVGPKLGAGTKKRGAASYQ